MVVCNLPEHQHRGGSRHESRGKTVLAVRQLQAERVSGQSVRGALQLRHDGGKSRLERSGALQREGGMYDSW